MSASAVALGSARAVPLPRRGPAGANVVVGTLIFVAAEAMLFAGLVSAFLVLRARAASWPGLDQARFPLGLTAANLLLLEASAYTVGIAQRAARAGHGSVAARWLLATAAAGVVFLGVQGVEWTRLVGHALRSGGGGVYGGLFSVLIGVHGVHVLGGVGALVVVWRGLERRRVDEAILSAVTAATLYWRFVAGVWPILWILLYLY